jgi:hypothetical protein
MPEGLRGPLMSLKLGNISPSLTQDNATDVGLSYAECFRDLRLAFTFRVSFANFANVIFGQFCLMVRCSHVARWFTVPVLLAHVIHILQVRAKEQMLRIAARLVIASMTNFEAIRYRAKVKLIANAVSVMRFTQMGYLPVSTLEAAGLPSPTGTISRLSDVRPKAICKWQAAKTTRLSIYEGVGGMLCHVISSLLASGRAGGDSQSLPGVSIGLHSFILPREAH